MTVKSCLVRKHTFRLRLRAWTPFEVITLGFQEAAQLSSLQRGGREARTWTVPVETELRHHIRLPAAASPRSSHLCLLWQVDVPPAESTYLGTIWKNIIRRTGQYGGSVWNQLIGDTPAGSSDVKAVANPAAISGREIQRDFRPQIPCRSLKVWSHLHCVSFQQNFWWEVYSVFVLHDALLDLHPTYLHKFSDIQTRLFLICCSFSSVCRATNPPLFL